ncbi:MAG: LPP20 family lipoprotein [Bacteroidota bacterium]
MKNLYITRLLGILFMLLAPSQGLTQSIDHIRNSGLYYYGIGEGANLFIARNQARASLSEQISVHIKSDFQVITQEENDDINIFTTGVVSSYTTAVIGRQEERVLSEEPGRVEVLVYITRESMEEIFRQREQLIRDFIVQAGRATKERRISDALRYYYWALVLTRSHPDNSKLRHVFDGTSDEPLMMGLYDRIDRIFSFIRVDVKDITEADNPYRKYIHLGLTYRDQPIQDLDYTYWLGDGYSPMVTARDGMGIATLEGEFARLASNLRMQIEFRYANKAHLEPDVKTMMESVVIPDFPRSEIRIELQKEADVADTTLISENTLATAAVATSGFEVIETGAEAYKFYQQAIAHVINAIQQGTHQQVKEMFTTDAYTMYEKLLVNGYVSVLDPQIDTLRIMRMENETIVRSVPMLFAYHNNRNRFIENVVFDFDQNNKICNISFALGNIAVNDILSKPEAFGTENDKYFLIRFMENYKTAFALKRIDYLEAIFDENALIIVGNIVQRSVEPLENMANMYGSLSTQEVEYIRLSKSEYMDRLRHNFSRNEFINIHFEDNEVRKTQRDDKIYGIQIAQHYHSSTYADKGYLFLMIDLNDTLNPKVYVRTWQPEKNPDGSIYGLEDFRF